MIKTGFLGIDSGAITWAVLLDGFGSALLAAVLAFGAAWFAFDLQRKHAEKTALVAAVTEYRDRLQRLVLAWAADGEAAPSPAVEIEVTSAVTMAASRVRSLCQKDDERLSEGVKEITAFR